MLYAIKRSYRVTQRGLCDKLGVTAPTVSRMVDSLEECGLVVRSVWAGDKRSRVVSLTEHGIRVFNGAMRAALCSGLVAFLVSTTFAIQWYSETACSTELLLFEAVLHYARGQLFDRATLVYPFHPDD